MNNFRLYALCLKSLNSKNGSDVINSLSPSLLLRHVECSGDQILLLPLDLHHLSLNGLLGDVLVDEDIFGLTDSVHSVKALKHEKMK